MLKKLLNSKHFQSFLEQAGTSGFALISFIILARVLSIEDFGQWTLYLTLLTFLDMIRFGLVKTALIKYSSGIENEHKKELIGSSWFLNLLSVSFIGIISYIFYFLNVFELEGIILFLLIYPLYSLISMPFFYFLWNNQVLLKFKKIAYVRIFNSSLFLFVCLVSLLINLSLKELVITHMLVFSISSVLTLFLGNTGYKFVFNSNKLTIKKILLFAKYHTMAFIGSNLLKSSDIFLIGFFLNPIAIAIYSVPLRLVELIESPLKSAISVVFPLLSAHDNNKDINALNKTLQNYIGVLTLIYIPFMVVLFVISEPLIYFIAGEKYLGGVFIFRLFLIYGIFLPFDRLTGITLDAIGKPKLNFYKVLIMALVNILGDFIALYFFESINMVAMVTICNVIAGMLVGLFFLKKEVNLNFRSIFISSSYLIKNYIAKHKVINTLTKTFKL